MINPSAVESLPGIWIDDPVTNLDCRDMRKALGACRKAPEMAYMLRRRSAETSFLSRLNWEDERLPIVRTQHGYALRSDVRDAWNTLEQTFVVITSVLLESQSRNPEALFPFDAHWPLPADFGYRQPHPDTYRARRAAIRARDACILLLARCSMALALCTQSDEQPPRWLLTLNEHGVPAPWVDLLRTSVIADFSPGLRVGAFIDPAGVTAWVNHVPCMIRANLPVYIKWPLDVTSVVQNHPFLLPYTPSPEGIPVVHAEDEFDARLLRFRWVHVPQPSGPVPWRSTLSTLSEGPSLHDYAHADQGPSGTQTSGEQTPPEHLPVVSDDLRPPKPPHGPGQRPGETWQDFMARRRSIHTQQESAADGKRREACEARRRKAQTYARPVRPTTVYLWTTAGEIDPDLPAEWLELDYRQYVSFKAVRDLWARYPDSQKVYDAWTDAWEIYPKLSDEEPFIEDDIFFDEDEDEETQVVSLPAGQVALSSFYESHLRWFYEDDGGRTLARFRPTMEAFYALTRFRYGLIPAVVETAGIEYDRFSELAVRKMFGLVDESLDDTDRAIVRPISGLAAAFLQRPAQPSAPGLIWDLHSTCDDYLFNRFPGHIRLTSHIFDGSRWWRVRYDAPEDRDLWWSLFVDDTTVLELLRRTGIQRVRHACSLLVQRGTKFRMAYHPSQRDMQGFAIQAPVPIYLGWREPNFRPDGWDYKVYEAQAYEILSAPRGRAALLHGGIVWRLGVEMLGQEGVDTALGGPSADIWRRGRGIQEPRGVVWYEEYLTPHELDVICGVYKVYTGEIVETPEDIDLLTVT